jgi:hypothetical protein
LAVWSTEIDVLLAILIWAFFYLRFELFDFVCLSPAPWLSAVSDLSAEK